MSIKLKIGIMLGIPLVALAVLVIYGFYSLERLSQTTDSLVKDSFTPLIEVDFASINTMRASIK